MSSQTGIDAFFLRCFVSNSVLFSGSICRDQDHDDQKGKGCPTDQKQGEVVDTPDPVFF
jgi:hypothetical protein